MTIQHPIRRALARVCSAETMTRIVDPVLADVRWERRLRVFGYVDLARALALHAIVSSPRAAGRLWSDDRRAMPRAALLCGAVGLVTAAVLAIPPLLRLDVPTGRALLFLAPQLLILTIPAALLAAIPIALRGVPIHARLIRQTLGLALCVVGFTLVLPWTFPRTNQAFRVLVARHHIAPGPNELGFVELRERIRVAREVGGNDATVRRLEYSFQNRVALVFAPIPIALLALGLAASRAGRRRPIVTGVSATILYFGVLLPALSLMTWWLLRGLGAPPIPIAWIPNAVTLGIAALFFQNRTLFAQNTENAIPPSP
jgi:hypothetical protein